jgi:hypothetical protein
MIESIKSAAKEEKRVSGDLDGFEKRQQLHLQRASSAKSERIETLAKHRLDWEGKITSKKESAEADLLSLATKGY